MIYFDCEGESTERKPLYQEINGALDRRGIIRISPGETRGCSLGLRHHFPSIYFRAIKTTQLVDRDRNDPTDDEESDDNVAEHAKVAVQLTHEAPKWSLQVELFCHEPKCFYAADGEGYHHRYESYSDVVVELADRFHKGPSIDAQHQYGICGVDQRHTGGKEGWKDENRPKRQTLGRFRSRDYQHTDLGRGTEPEAEQYPQRVHMPAMADQLEHGTEEAGKKSPTAEQQIEVFFQVLAASPNTYENTADGSEN